MKCGKRSNTLILLSLDLGVSLGTLTRFYLIMRNKEEAQLIPLGDQHFKLVLILVNFSIWGFKANHLLGAEVP
jgi:hypothetical protein